ncbi:class I SAM-dependent RNA methyltransferase [Knoellia sp. Soil729]|uniref:class I SAM-dependent RNA methyltransferase n=1 Tax=Knoellia sp. Soil729 TaxID=1736394 RepID=UPI000700BCE6|nr:class I SAM-dependent RNA methyltransferase [Knoellia sp. Soil729]KRE40234.1 SAM-dependent methyltransferase [Knoellia sp. Soil729]
MSQEPGTPSTAELVAGSEVVVDAGPIAHGGFVVARHEGRVLFVRHALPGEQVRVRVTEGAAGDRFLRADAVEVLAASPDRVQPPCPYAGPGLCGGCDFQHVDVAAQRRLKATVVAEQLQRLAHLERDVVVEPVPGDTHGLRWRTRTEFAVDPAGRAGMRRHRSHALLPIDDCLIASERVVGTAVLQADWAGEKAVDVVAPSDGDAVVVRIPSDEAVAPVVTENVAAQSLSREFDVSARGFWQVHPGAAATFVDAVIAGLDPQPGERCLDLYAGVGVFASALAQAVGERGQVIAVESDSIAVAQARLNVASTPWVRYVQGRVDHVFGVESTGRVSGTRKGGRRRPGPRRPSSDIPPTADLVVLDPPRTGAGKAVVGAVVALGPRALAYVACDPAALARDTAYLLERGYALTSLRAFDAFPMTHHVECVAVFTRTGPDLP